MKTERTTISLEADLMQAAQSFAGNEGRTFSGMIAILLREHLTAHGALPSQDDAEWQVICAGLKEVCTKDELREILDRRTTPEAKKEAIR